MKPVVYIVHAVDVEGPMTETLEATFERMWDYGLPRSVKTSKENLRRVQQGAPIEGLKPEVAELLRQTFTDHLLGYWGDWKAIDAMMADINSPAFRNKYCGKDGSPYVLSWFIYDHHHDFTNNPRFHAVGTHVIHDHYMDLFLKKNPYSDGIYWHYHHPPVNGDALGCNTGWSSMVTHESIVARRIIEREWYFSCFRAGLHIERNDMSHWLEMYVPFDFSARYVPDRSFYKPGFEFDWRHCPSKWGGWHPDWYDYRREGSMKRWQFRCTDLWTRMSSLTESEVEEAFTQARDGGSAVLLYYDHDYRDMRVEIDAGYAAIKKVAARHPDIDFKWVTALEAAQKHLGIKPEQPRLDVTLGANNMVEVTCPTPIFGPQPFLAIQQGQHFFRDNFTDEGNGKWSYQLRYRNEVNAVGVAASSPSGLTDVKVLRLVAAQKQSVA